jgi:hypothetical protein
MDFIIFILCKMDMLDRISMQQVFYKIFLKTISKKDLDFLSKQNQSQNKHVNISFPI